MLFLRCITSFFSRQWACSMGDGGVLSSASRFSSAVVDAAPGRNSVWMGTGHPVGNWTSALPIRDPEERERKRERGETKRKGRNKRDCESNGNFEDKSNETMIFQLETLLYHHRLPLTTTFQNSSQARYLQTCLSSCRGQ